VHPKQALFHWYRYREHMHTYRSVNDFGALVD